MEAHRSWIEEVVGGTVLTWSRPANGGSRETWFVDVVGPDGSPQKLVLRTEGEGSFSGTEITLAREAVAYRALAKVGVPVPTILGVNGDGTAVLMTRAAGDSDLTVLTPEERDATMRDFVDRLAELHQIPVESMDLPGFDRPNTAEEHAVIDIDRWMRLSDRVVDLDPLVAYTGGWLRQNAPRSVARTTFVQSDTGPGNFVASDGKVTAFVDMEFSHLGDPMDDLAWLLYRSRPLAIDRATLLDRYTRRSGVPISEPSIAYYALAVEYRCAVTTSLAVARGRGARGLAPYLLQTQRYLEEIASRLCVLAGVDEPAPPLPAFAPTPRTAWFDNVVQALRGAAKGLGDEALRDDTRNTQIYVQYLRAYDAIGTEIDRADRVDLERVLGGETVGDPRRLAGAAGAAGAAGDATVLRCLLRRQSRRRALWAALLDRPRR